MRSRTLHLPPGPCRREPLVEAAAGAQRAPDFALAFLPPNGHLRESLTALAAAWPDSLRFGCEAVTQFADQGVATGGPVQAFWFDDPRHAATVEVLTGTHGEPPARRKVQALARHLAGADGALLIVDGLRFPAEELLAELRRELGGQAPQVAGGLASQAVPV